MSRPDTSRYRVGRGTQHAAGDKFSGRVFEGTPDRVLRLSTIATAAGAVNL